MDMQDIYVDGVKKLVHDLFDKERLCLVLQKLVTVLDIGDEVKKESRSVKV